MDACSVRSLPLASSLKHLKMVARRVSLHPALCTYTAPTLRLLCAYTAPTLRLHFEHRPTPPHLLHSGPPGHLTCMHHFGHPPLSYRYLAHLATLSTSQCRSERMSCPPRPHTARGPTETEGFRIFHAPGKARHAWLWARALAEWRALDSRSMTSRCHLCQVAKWHGARVKRGLLTGVTDAGWESASGANMLGVCPLPRNLCRL